MLNIEEVTERLIQTAGDLRRLADNLQYGYPNLSKENKELVRLAYIPEVNQLALGIQTAFAAGNFDLYRETFERIDGIVSITAIQK